MTVSSTTSRWLRPRIVAVLVVAVLMVTTVAALSASAWAYGATVRDGAQLLPGTTISSVPVGDTSVEEAIETVSAHLAPTLDRTITVTHGDLSWETTPRDLGAVTDLDAVVTAAAARADDLGFADLVKLRWLGSTDGLVSDVAVSVPEDEVAAFVATIAHDLDRAPRDAEVGWVDGAVTVTVEGRDGRDVEQDEAVLALTEIVTGDGTELTVPLTTAAPAITTDIAEQVAHDVGAAVDVALDRAVTVSLDGRTETITGRELGADPEVDPLVAAALAAATSDGDPPSFDVALTVADERIGAVLDTVTAGSAVPARNASLDLSNGGFKVTPERNGAAVDRAEALAKVHAALDGAADRVELELRTVRPTITADAFRQVLVVDHSTTTVTLYEGGEARKAWPVAIGTNNSPTPKGTFVVGAKRYEPTWVNPARDRWGKDMPERIGPGPDNPLGARALNWNRPGGGDTLIRFHGTPNEASIGTASSNGCVRMFNKDVIELYDMVSTGTTIISKD